MADLLQTGAAWLAGQLKASVSVAAIYTRPGLGSVALQATLGSQLLKVTDGRGNVRYERTDRDFVFSVADLVIAGQAIIPAPADTVDVTLNGVTERFEVMPVNRGMEPAWRYCDPFKTLMRVHSKLVSAGVAILRKGYVITDLATADSRVNAITLQSDGKIVATGDIWNATGDRKGAVRRYNSNGTVDLSFGVSGNVTFNYQSSSDQTEPLAVAVQPDGKILSAGYSVLGSSITISLARITATGVLDVSFGTGGIATLSRIGIDIARAVVVLSAGKIVIAGASTGNALLVCFNADGTLDTTFGTGGTVLSMLGAASAGFYALAIDVSGKIVAVGAAGNNFAVSRFAANGTLDATFGTSGITSTAIPGTTSANYASAVAIQPDGKILLAGKGAITAQNTEFALARYSSLGVSDSSFGTSGIVTTQYTSLDFAAGMGLQNDGKIVVCGPHKTVASPQDADFSVLRYNADGSVDGTFAQAGLAVTSLGTLTDVPQNLAMQSDGKILVGGYTIPASTGWAVARYNRDGTLDAGFGDLAA